jgi:hypothetical protein
MIITRDNSPMLCQLSYLCWCCALRWIWCLWCYSWVYIHTGQAWKICQATVLPLPTELRGQVGSNKWYFGTESSSFDTNVMIPVWIPM